MYSIKNFYYQHDICFSFPLQAGIGSDERAPQKLAGTLRLTLQLICLKYDKATLKLIANHIQE